MALFLALSVLCGKRPLPRANARVPIHMKLSGRNPTQGDRKGPIHSSSPLPPLQRDVLAKALFRVLVRAGVGWCGAGTLVVALGWGASPRLARSLHAYDGDRKGSYLSSSLLPP